MDMKLKIWIYIQQGIFKRPADVSPLGTCQGGITGYKESKRQSVSSKAKAPVAAPVEEVAKGSRRAVKRSPKKKDSMKDDEEVSASDPKTKGRPKKKNSGSPLPDENTILLENMAVTDTWIEDDRRYYRPLTRSMMYNMINGKTDAKLKKEPVEGRSKKN